MSRFSRRLSVDWEKMKLPAISTAAVEGVPSDVSEFPFAFYLHVETPLDYKDSLSEVSRSQWR
jgi:hypothetical protein